MTPLALKTAYFVALQRNIATAGAATWSGQFGGKIMSVKAIKWAWQQSTGLRSTDKFLLIYLADRYNDDQGFAWPSIARMSRDTKISKSAIKQCLKRLEEAGYIRRRKRFKIEDGSRFTSAIHLAHEGPLPNGVLAPFSVRGWFDQDGNWDQEYEKDV